MTNLVKLDNSLSTVKRRENIMAVQHKIDELGYPIWWNGVKWVNYNGTVV